MEVVDRTGQPRTDKEILEAIQTIKEIMIKQALVLPMLTVHAGIIVDGLTECLDRRASERKERQQNAHTKDS